MPIEDEVVARHCERELVRFFSPDDLRAQLPDMLVTHLGHVRNRVVRFHVVLGVRENQVQLDSNDEICADFDGPSLRMKTYINRWAEARPDELRHRCLVQIGGV